MARPRKDTNSVEARQRIIEGFWTLLESHYLDEITIAMVADEAKCNRGTFYYHYADMDSLIHEAIERELLVERDMPGMVFELACGIEDSPSRCLGESPDFYRLSLLMEHGGMGRVIPEAKRTMVGLWETILAPGEAKLPEATREIIEYLTSGMLGLIAYRTAREQEGRQAPPAFATDDFLKANAAFMIERIALSLGMTHADVLARLHIASCLMQSNRLREKTEA